MDAMLINVKIPRMTEVVYQNRYPTGWGSPILSQSREVAEACRVPGNLAVGREDRASQILVLTVITIYMRSERSENGEIDTK